MDSRPNQASVNPESEVRMCEHTPTLGLDGIIRCKRCGDLLPHMDEEIDKTQSAKRANRILEEIAVSGGYFASGFSNGFIVYCKNEEILTAEKLGERNFVVTKRTLSKV